MLVMSRIATSASTTSLSGTIRAAANPAKMTASDARSSRVSSRRPASEASPNCRAMPPSIPSSTWPKAIKPSPQPSRPAATAAPAATLAPNAAQVTCAGDRPSVRCTSRSSGRSARSNPRPTAGAKSYMDTEPPEIHHDVRRQQHRKQDAFLHPVRDAGEPPTGHPGRVRVQRHLLEAHAVVHGDVDRKEHEGHDAAEEDAQRHDPQQ